MFSVICDLFFLGELGSQPSTVRIELDNSPVPARLLALHSNGCFTKPIQQNNRNNNKQNKQWPPINGHRSFILGLPPVLGPIRRTNTS